MYADVGGALHPREAFTDVRRLIESPIRGKIDDKVFTPPQLP